MKLHEIKSKIELSPTMMGLAEEKRIINDIMKNTPEDIKANVEIFSEIMSNLLISRSTSFYEIATSDEDFFCVFSEWLLDLARFFEGPRHEEFTDLSRIYSTSPHNFKQFK